MLKYLFQILIFMLVADLQSATDISRICNSLGDDKSL